jgi:glycosyltransferase involved in cell wall biosynthesis
MALKEAEYFRDRFDLVISVPDGPLRASFAQYGALVQGTTSMPLWGDSAKRWIGRSVRSVTRAIRLARVIRRNKVDVVLTNSSVLLAPIIAARIAGVPALVHVRDVPVSRLAPLVFKIESWLAQSLILISESMRPLFPTSPGTRITLIPEGIELHEPTPSADAFSAGRFHHPLRLGVIGGIHPRKGQDLAIEALHQLATNGVPATLDIVGRAIDPAFATRLESLASDLGVADRIRFVGEIDNVPEYLRDIDLVIAPSRGEWTPLVLMEAMAEGKPVVAADVGGVADVVTDRSTGLLIPSGDPRRLATAITELAADPSTAAEMAARGRTVIYARFDLRETLRALENEVRAVLTEHGGP